ncbi:MAG: tetratricopeptide repeat protein [Cryomorphaceae bacterium]|nr:tetratricopeptide repeat protein [Flavobacteriales bacterium]
MKRILSIVFIATAVTAMGQNAKVVSAYNAKESGEYKEAREYIDEAITHEKTMGKEKTWRYRGQIYQLIAMSDDDFGVSKAEAVETAIQSFLKAQELDEKERYLDQTKLGLAQSQNLALNLGIEAYNEKNYEDSRDLFLTAAKAAEKAGVTDTLAIYNAGLSAEQAGDNETALEQYKKASETGYQGALMYVYMANIHQKQGNDEEYLKAIKEGRKAYPENSDLIVYELNWYLQNEKFEEARENLQLAIKNEPDNEQLYFSLGVVYDNLGETDKAADAYKDAIEIKEDYFDAIYNLGAMYFNQGVEMNNAANDIEDNAKYKAARDEAKQVFLKSRPFLEKAHELDPKDTGAIASLSQLYAMIGENEKYEEMKKKLEAAKQ